MAGKKFVKCAAALVLTIAILFSSQAVVPASAAKSLSQLQQEQSALKKKQAEVAAKLKNLRADKAKKVEYKQALDAQVGTVQSQIDVLNQQISALDADITDKQTQIAGKQQDINKNYDLLKQRLHALYLTGEASNLEIILSAKNVVDLADKTEAIKAITTHDTNLINTLKSDMQSIQAQKAQIEANRQNVASAKVTLDQKRSELSSLQQEAKQVIADISANESSAKEQSAELSAKRKAADAAIDDWFKKYYEDQKKNQGGSGGGSGGFTSTGNFTWPVPGVNTVTSGFGSRWGSFHKGIDISGPGVYGRPIVAADSGRVMMAGWGNYGTGYGGYGNVVAIDHGGGYSTLYGHCSSVAVSAGQIVTKGQVIAYVGNTGDSQGAHCHFEVRVNGVAQNPLNWFSR